MTNKNIWSKILDEETLALAVEILADQALVQDKDLTDFFNLLFRAEATHRVVASFSFDEKLCFLESVLLLKGTQLGKLIEYIRGFVMEEDQERFFDYQCGRLNQIFNMVYGLLSAQPYALYLFLVFPQVIQEERTLVAQDLGGTADEQAEDEAKLENLDRLVGIWSSSRGNVSDDDFRLFLFEKAERAVALIRDFELTEGHVTSRMDEVLITFILKCKALSDKDLLRKALGQIKS